LEERLEQTSGINSLNQERGGDGEGGKGKKTQVRSPACGKAETEILSKRAPHTKNKINRGEGDMLSDMRIKRRAENR